MKIVIFGGSFNPPGKHHCQIAKELSRQFNLVIIVPCGPLPDKPSANIIELKHRKEMVELAFTDLVKPKQTKRGKTRFDFFDLDNRVYTPTYFLQKRYEKKFPRAEIWHLVGSDIIIGGRGKKSEIHRVWQRGNKIWKNLNFLVGLRPNYDICPEDLPPKARTIKIKNADGSGTEIRRKIKSGESLENLLIPEVAGYIKKNKLYGYLQA